VTTLGWNAERADITYTGPDRLPYCWMGSGGKGNFNAAGDSGSGAGGDSNSWLICQKSCTSYAEPTIPCTGSEASYALGGRSSPTCPTKYTPILTLADCRLAATALKNEIAPDSSEEITGNMNEPRLLEDYYGNDRLPYCWLGASGKANFNPYGDKGTKDNVDQQSQVFCKKFCVDTS